jgi:hypothetical protein
MIVLNIYMAYSGKFNPTNIDKYRGDASAIIYRSLWELKLMKYLDQHSGVLEWTSEELVIPYRSPIDNRIHRYFPDFWVRKKDPSGVVTEVVIEVKPKQQLVPPKKPSRITRRYLTEVRAFAVNQRKFETAVEYCNHNGMIFQVMTQDDLGVI